MGYMRFNRLLLSWVCLTVKLNNASYLQGAVPPNLESKQGLFAHSLAQEETAPAAQRDLGPNYFRIYR